MSGPLHLTPALSGFSAASTSIRTLLSSVCPVTTALCTFLPLKIQKGINSLVWHQPVSFQNTSAPSGVFPSFRFLQALRASVPLEQSPMQSLVSVCLVRASLRGPGCNNSPSVQGTISTCLPGSQECFESRSGHCEDGPRLFSKVSPHWISTYLGRL